MNRLKIIRRTNTLKFKDLAQEKLMNLVDHAIHFRPPPAPPAEILRQGRLVSHRGSHDGRTKNGGASQQNEFIFENTLPALKRAVEQGAWGVEFDVRWTRDDVPVIHHDKTAKRVFGHPLLISEVTSTELRRSLPKVPTLREAIGAMREASGTAVKRDLPHLMIELKKCTDGWSKKRLEIFANELIGLKPVEDFHLISLDAKLLLSCEFVPREALLPVAELNVRETSRLALREKMGGMSGQYILLSNALIARHHEAGQKVGSGFAANTAILHRELGRGIDWVFTNHVGDRARDLHRP